MRLLDLLAEGAALGQLCLAACGLAEDGGAGGAVHHRGGVREHGRDLVAPGALDVHEEGVRALYKTLELVGLGLDGSGGVEKVPVGRSAHRVVSGVSSKLKKTQ